MLAVDIILSQTLIFCTNPLDYLDNFGIDTFVAGVIEWLVEHCREKQDVRLVSVANPAA